MGYKEIALPLAVKGIPTTPVLPNSKRAFLEDWPSSATTDSEEISKLNDKYPNHNAACVATGKPDGVWFLEVDSPDVVNRIQQETGQQIPDTFRVRSRPGRGHFYWKNTPASLAMGNISQTYVKCGDWSARVANEYVVAPGSIHPNTGKPYESLRDEPIIEAPDWLIEWLLSQKVEKKAILADSIPKNEAGLIPHGYIHGYMLTQAGKLRNMGLDQSMIESALLDLVHKNCQPPIDDDKVRQMARSICQYPAGDTVDLILTQPSAQLSSQIPALVEPPEPLVFEDYSYPKFPRWVMEGTSIYENFVKPTCEHNSRIDYFMWLPAMAGLLNYLGTKVQMRNNGFGARPLRGSIYQILIGRKGKTNKSSSVNDALDYLHNCGVLSHAGRDTTNAEGRTLVWTIGSPEGLGLDMQRCNCKNAILFYDELSQLVSKAAIDTSALTSALLTMYESGKFQNSVKSTKEKFSHDPDTYCTSLIACTTDKKFPELWSKMAGSDTGLDDRFMFIIQPAVLPEPRLQTFINTMMGSVETKKLIDKALNQKEYALEDGTRLTELAKIENRYANRAEKWALGLAVDMGLDSIDTDCVDRAIAIVEYEIAVKNYLKTYEATTREGQIQQEARRILEQAKGRMALRELKRKAHADKHGTSVWHHAYQGLIAAGVIREDVSKGFTEVILLMKRDFDDD